MNLIEQSNILKGLTDESLHAELSSPSGATPPFLLATEISRRKAQRERYEGAKAKAPATTVLQDLMGAKVPGTSTEGFAAQLPVQPTGLEAALPGMGAPPTTAPVQGFAQGGLVNALDYDAIGARYAETLNGLDDRKDRARALALLQAGAGIMGNGSSNFLTNIGAGVSAGTTAYGSSLDQIDQDEQAALAAALDLQRVQQGDELTRLQFDWTKDRAAQEDALTREGWAREELPASIREARAYDNMSDAEKATYDKLNPAPASTQTDPMAENFNDIYMQVDKAYPPLSPRDTMGKTPEEVAAVIAARDQQVALAAYQRIKSAYGAEAAARYARQAGISDGDVLTGGSAPTSAPSSGAVGFETYFN